MGRMSNKVFSKEEKSKEVRMFEEEQRIASAVTQAKHCAWIKWNDIKLIELSWKSLIAMELLAISFLLCLAYDLLPNATNLKLQGYTDSDLNFLCKSDWSTLRYLHVHNHFRCTHGDITRCWKWS